MPLAWRPLCLLICVVLASLCDAAACSSPQSCSNEDSNVDDVDLLQLSRLAAAGNAPSGKYKTTCFEVKHVPNIDKGVWVCAPRTKSPAERYPLVVFGHGDVTRAESYSGLLQQVASFGFVVAGYQSLNTCSSDMPASACRGGKAAFLEVLKIIDAWSAKAPSNVPVNMSAGVTAMGHSTGGRAVFMVAAVKDDPTYLAGVDGGWYTQQLDANSGALRKAAARVAAVVPMHPDQMYDPQFNPDVAGFNGAIKKTPVFAAVTTKDKTTPPISVWRDFRMVKSRNRIYGSFVSRNGHDDPVKGHVSGPWAAVFAQAFALGDRNAYNLLYGSSPKSMRNAADFGNTGKGEVPLLLCEPGACWPGRYSEYCN